MNMKLKTYSELKKIKTYEDRYNYLKIGGEVGKETFGSNRYLNQNFYRSKEWKQVRRDVILRDNGCDLGVEGHEIMGRIYIHHMNPITVQDFNNDISKILDPEYLVCVSFDTHNDIHYGTDFSSRSIEFKERKENDTIPWKNKNYSKK